jgi:hypothetical protein
MSFYPFEYFCGANVVVKIEGLPLLEIAGISYEITESKRPLFGYSSRHFDGVARGQVLIEGSLVINYVHQDYLYHGINLGVKSQRGGTPDLLRAPDGDVSQNFRNHDNYSAAETYREAPGFAQRMKDTHWVTGQNSIRSEVLPTFNAHDLARGVDIRIIYGEQSEERPNGITGELLRGVYFKGRGKRIEISEDVIVEAYSFFARNTYSLRNPADFAVIPLPEDALINDEALLVGVSPPE